VNKSKGPLCPAQYYGGVYVYEIAGLLLDVVSRWQQVFMLMAGML
jgi:hypothetical protein